MNEQGVTMNEQGWYVIRQNEFTELERSEIFPEKEEADWTAELWRKEHPRDRIRVHRAP